MMKAAITVKKKAFILPINSFAVRYRKYYQLNSIRSVIRSVNEFYF